MNNKIAIISDTHFGIKKGSDVFVESQIRFFKEQFVPYLKEKKIKTIFFLGDLFDNRSSINVKIKNDVFDLFENYLKDFKIYLIIGNHDAYYNTNINIHSLKFFSKFDNIQIIDKITTVTIHDKNILLVPWITDNQDLLKENNKDVDLCFGHFDIKGCNFNKFKVSEHGMDVDVFPKKCKIIFSGHFHIRSKQTFKDKEIIYVGSPYQLTRNDINEERGFIILDLNTNKYDHINNTKSLKYIKLNYPEMFSKDRIENNIIDVYINKNDIYDEDKIDKYIDIIESYNPVENISKFILENSIESTDLNISNINVNSITDLIQIYIDSLNINNKNDIYNELIKLYKMTKGEVYG